MLPCTDIHGIMGIKHYAYDAKHSIEFVGSDLAQCRPPYKGDVGSTPTIGTIFYFCFYCI